MECFSVLSVVIKEYLLFVFAMFRTHAARYYEHDHGSRVFGGPSQTLLKAYQKILTDLPE
jgi:hypothetical protein